ncbi:MAG: hypothetical protein ACM3PS_01020 [Syntrophothermus sp.]
MHGRPDGNQILVAKASHFGFTERWGEPITVTPVQIGSVTGYHASRGDSIRVVMWDAFADAGKRIDQAGMLSIANSMPSKK